jgi:perosamine synthetase
MMRLIERGIESRRFFYPIHIMPPYRKYVEERNNFTISERLASCGLNLPISVKLSKDKICKIAYILKYYKK